MEYEGVERKATLSHPLYSRFPQETLEERPWAKIHSPADLPIPYYIYIYIYTYSGSILLLVTVDEDDDDDDDDGR